MEILTQLAAKLHILSAMYWTGAMIFLAVVGNPMLNLVRPPSFQRQISRRTWQMAHRSMWMAIGILIVSGLLLFWDRGFINPRILSLNFFRTPMGEKIAITGLMVALSLLHDMSIGPGARLKDPASTEPPGRLAIVTPWLLAIGAVAATLISIGARPPRG